MKNSHDRKLQLGTLLAAGGALTGVGLVAITLAPISPVFQRALLLGLAFLLLSCSAAWLLTRQGRSLTVTPPVDPALTEERMRMALEATRIAVWDWDIVSGAQIVNATWIELLGLPASTITADFTAWKTRIHPDDLERVMASINAHFSGKAPIYDCEYRLKTGSDSWTWVLSRGQVVSRAADGEALRMIGTMREISERRAAEEALQRRDAILDAVSVTAGRLLTVPSWHDVLPDMLASLAMAAQAGHAYAYEVAEKEPGQPLAVLVGQWANPCSPGASGEPLLGFSRWRAILANDQIIQGNASSFPEAEQQRLNALGVRSLIIVPIHTGDHLWGCLGLEDCQNERRWEAVEQDALHAAANVLAAAIQRQRLVEADREERRVAEELRETAIVFGKSLNYDTVLNRLLDQTPRIVPYDGGSILLVRGSQAYVARQRGYDLADPDYALAAAVTAFSIAETPNLLKVMESLQPVIIPNTQAYPGWVPVENYPYRSWIGSPLIVEGKVEAIISLDKLETDFYTSVHAARLSMFAGQASLALHNAMLFAETIEALEHEHKLSEITRAISSELDLSVILPAIVRMAVELAETDAGSMAILEETDQMLSYSYLYNLPHGLDNTLETRSEGVAWTTIYNRQPVRLADYGAHPGANPRWTAAGIHAYIGVPVIAGSTCLGTLSVFSYDPDRRFEPRDQALVELVGRQAGVAIRNARLFEAAQRRAIEAETLRQAASSVSSALELSEVLDQILEQLQSVIPYDSAAIFLVENDAIRMKAGRGLVDLANLLDRNYASDDYLFNDIDHTCRPVILADAQADPRFESWGSGDTYIHGWIGLPLRVHEQRIGYLTVDSSKVGAYQISDGDLAQAFADEVAIAIENARLFQQVQLLAITDPLTGLYNRRYFFEAAQREFERAKRYLTPLSIILVDLDLFKQVNDTYGHLAGDRVLVSIAAKCRDALREVDVPARYGGEEFIFLLPQTDLAGAQLLAERLHSRIMDQPIDAGSQRIQVSASLGVAELDPFCTDLQTLVQHADLALYQTKNTGRGRITVWAPVH
jgi:diguanylate cyclase (GGDEF)-like protein